MSKKEVGKESEAKEEEVNNGKEAETKAEKVLKPVLDSFGCFVRWE